MDSVRAWAPAKLNLWLAVLGRRADGYHELDTVMAAIGLADELVLRRCAAPGLRLEVYGPSATSDIPTDRRNLAYAATEAALERAVALGCDAPAGLELRLDKRVPSRAGLGGGSSDAATALRLVERLLAVDLGADWRRGWLAAAGSDTVFFDAAGPGGHARCGGRGERVEALSRLPAEWHVVVATPELEASTGAIFAALGAGSIGSGPPPRPPRFAALEHAAAQAALRNDLQPAALGALPELASWAEHLARLGGVRFQMTGSGSSFYALCPTGPEAARVHAALEAGLAGARLLWSGPFAPLAGI